jgi:thiamine biosynthesis lipoprotein
MEVSSQQFRVMASSALVTLTNPHPAALDTAQTRLAELEQRWSRFIDTSDITRLNHAQGGWVPVAVDTAVLIQTMQRASTATGGSYDPTYLHQLVTTGYAASIDDPNRITIAIDAPSREHSVHDIHVDPTSNSVFMPHGVSLDPGGIGKGLAADLVVMELLRAGTAGALISIGGDIAAAGQPPTPGGWMVNVENPLKPSETLTTMTVSAGGIATSSTCSRRWLHNGSERHHVIDPVTGTTSHTDLAAVTVIANAGWLAEAHATAALLRGSAEAIPYLESHELTGISVGADHSVNTTPDLQVAKLCAEGSE